MALPSRTALLGLAGCAAAGVLGCLPGAAGAWDPISELAWLTLLAPAAGALCGAQGLTLLAAGGPVALAWTLLLVLADARSPRELASPLWAMTAVAGLFALGLAAGRLARGSGPALAGALLLLALLLSGLSLGLGPLPSGADLARGHPRLAAALLDLSPLTLVFDCAGWDWAHGNPELYARAGVEWFPRQPYPGNLAAPAVLVVGCSAYGLARRPRSVVAP